MGCEWVNQVYGGRFVGDQLAARGYVCLVYDALNWSDRGGAGFDGQQDGLFPVPSVKEAFGKMHRVWESQGVGDRLVTRLLPVQHTFNAATVCNELTEPPTK